MSVKATARAWDAGPDVEGSGLLVLLALADHAGGEDDPYGHAYPCVETLATMCRLSVRQVRRWLVKLKEDGFIEEMGSHYWGRGKTTKSYRILDRGGDTGDRVSPVTGGVTHDTQSVLSCSPTTEDSSPEQQETRARERLPKFQKRTVKPDLWDLTQRVVEEYGRQTGTSTRSLTATGNLTDTASRVYGRVKEFPDLDFDGHRDLIANTLASKWWGDGPPSIGVVYGPKVFEANLTRQPPRSKVADPGRFEESTRQAEAEFRQWFIDRGMEVPGG